MFRQLLWLNNYTSGWEKTGSSNKKHYLLLFFLFPVPFAFSLSLASCHLLQASLPWSLTPVKSGLWHCSHPSKAPLHLLHPSFTSAPGGAAAGAELGWLVWEEAAAAGLFIPFGPGFAAAGFFIAFVVLFWAFLSFRWLKASCSKSSKLFSATASWLPSCTGVCTAAGFSTLGAPPCKAMLCNGRMGSLLLSISVVLAAVIFWKASWLLFIQDIIWDMNSALPGWVSCAGGSCCACTAGWGTAGCIWHVSDKPLLLETIVPCRHLAMSLTFTWFFTKSANSGKYLGSGFSPW